MRIHPTLRRYVTEYIDNILEIPLTDYDQTNELHWPKDATYAGIDNEIGILNVHKTQVKPYRENINIDIWIERLTVT